MLPDPDMKGVHAITISILCWKQASVSMADSVIYLLRSDIYPTCKLYRQVDNTKVEFSGLPRFRRNIPVGIQSRASWGRVSL